MLGTFLLALMIITPTDQTVPVAKGTKLDINNFAGDVSIKVWERDAVRVEVNHSDRETVDIKQGEQLVTIRSRSLRGGPPRSLDYTISVPSWMAISVGGTYADVTLEGVGGDVTVETTRGDIKVRGGSGFVSLKSVQGEITLEKAKGRIEVRTVNEGIHLADINGDLSAETTNGSIILDRIDSGNVDLYTVNGNISYDGPVKEKGMYRLTTHNGMIAMAVPERVNATLMVRTYNGGFRSTFPIGGDAAEKRTKRFTVTLGNGSAHVELESFGGTIALRRPGEPRPETERRRTRDRDKDQAANLGIDQALQQALVAVQGIDIDQIIHEAIAGLPFPIPHPMPHPRPDPR
jgi:putative adhesin